MRGLGMQSGGVTPLIGKKVTETASVEADGVKVTITRTLTPAKQNGVQGIDVNLTGVVERVQQDGSRETVVLSNRDLQLILSCTSKLRFDHAGLGASPFLAIEPEPLGRF